MRVSLAPSFSQIKAPGTASVGLPLLDEAGAQIILGWTPCDLAAPIASSPSTLFGPRGIFLHPDGSLWVCDTGNRRALIRNEPQATGQRADIVLGQSDFDSRDENAGDDVNAFGMRWPRGLALWRAVLAVSDAGDNRIMLWKDMPDRSGASCDLVLGQKDFSGCDHNMAAYYPSAPTLNMPYAIAVARGRLIAADTASSRLIAFSQAEMGARADRLSGQRDFASKGDNGWGVAGRDSLCSPYGLCVRDELVAVADSGNNRVMLWPSAEASR